MFYWNVFSMDMPCPHNLRMCYFNKPDRSNKLSQQMLSIFPVGALRFKQPRTVSKLEICELEAFSLERSRPAILNHSFKKVRAIQVKFANERKGSRKRNRKGKRKRKRKTRRQLGEEAYVTKSFPRHRDR